MTLNNFSSFESSILPLALYRELIGEPHDALVACLLKVDGLPNLALGARFLDEACGTAEAGKGEGEMLADEDVGIVLAHGAYDAKNVRGDGSDIRYYGGCWGGGISCSGMDGVAEASPGLPFS